MVLGVWGAAWPWGGSALRAPLQAVPSTLLTFSVRLRLPCGAHRTLQMLRTGDRQNPQPQSSHINRETDK